MMNRIFSAFLCLLAGPVLSHAQSQTSPYTLFGIGSVDIENHGASTGMGGLGIGLRQENTLNSANPAALSDIGSRKFIMDISVYGSGSLYSGQGKRSPSATGNLDRVCLGFRAGNFICASAGLVPFSMTEYRISKTSFIEGSDDTFNTWYSGSGGLHKAYVTLAFDITKNLSAGITGSVIMGTVTHYEESDYWTTTRESTCNITPYADFGLQYRLPLGRYRSIVAGLTGGYKRKISMHNTVEVVSAADTSSVVDKVSPSTVHYIPAFAGAGISYSSRSLTVGIDYTFQKWSSVDSGSDIILYKDRNRLTFGLSWTPDRYDVRRYWKKISFRFGASADDSYLAVSGRPGLNWALSAGASFPVRNSTAFYCSFRFKRCGYPSHTRNTITENILTLTIGVSFCENWFERRKFQ